MTEPSSANFFIQIKWIHENNAEFYIRNLLTSIAIFLLSYYNMRYTLLLFVEMGHHASFRS
jgi:hypothetical protein